MTKNSQKLFLVLALVIIGLSFAAPLYGQEVHLLEKSAPIYEGVNAGESSSLPNYLNNIFRLGIGVATALAVIYIAIGGITMMITGSITKHEEGRAMIQRAVWGLVLALAGVLILQTINPEILQFNFIKRLQDLAQNIEEQPKVIPPNLIPPPAEAALRNELSQRSGNRITVPFPACESGLRPCTDLVGLPRNAIDGVVAAQQACDKATGGPGRCQLVVTGGAETVGHKTHGPGKPFVDIDDNDADFNSWVMLTADSSRDTPAGKVYVHGNDEYRDEPGSRRHWHVCFDRACE